MKNCRDCHCKMAVLGRQIMHMDGDGIVEAIVLTCPKCREMSFEHAAAYVTNAPEPKEGEKLYDYLKRTL